MRSKMADTRNIREGGYQPSADPAAPPKAEPLPAGTAFHPSTGMPIPAGGTPAPQPRQPASD
jgi:hypothetical protein